MNQNDEKILKLKAEIESKKKKLGKNTRFSPITNCMLTIEDKLLNINALPIDMLIVLLVRLNMYNMSAKDLGITDFIISSYHIEDWILDIQSKIDVLKSKSEADNLKNLEKKLEQLLSAEKQTELAIDEIAKFLV